jgi:acylphosphatase
MTDRELVAREVVVHGRVQGVFFRASCQREAQGRRVAGWVGNEPDGTVRAWFEGPQHDVDALTDWCRQGPPGARVDRVETADRDPQALPGGFQVR